MLDRLHLSQQAGILADKVNRRNLLFIVVVLGEAPCLATYWVSHFRSMKYVFCNAKKSGGFCQRRQSMVSAYSGLVYVLDPTWPILFYTKIWILVGMCWNLCRYHEFAFYLDNFFCSQSYSTHKMRLIILELLLSITAEVSFQG